MRSTHFPSSPPSFEGTVPTPSTKTTVNTTVTEDELTAAVGGLTISQVKINRTGDPFLEVPASYARVPAIGLSPTAAEFTPGRRFLNIQDSIPQDVSSQNKNFSSDAGQSKRAVLIKKQSQDVDGSLKTRITKKLMAAGLNPLSIESTGFVQNIEQCLIRFDDIRDSEKAFDVCLDNINDVEVSYLDPKAVSRLRGFPDTNTSNFDGQVTAFLMWNESPTRPVEGSSVITIFKQLLQTVSPVKIKAIQLLEDQQPRCRKLRVEFYQASAAANILRQHQFDTGRFVLEFDRYDGRLRGPITPMTSSSDGGYPHSPEQYDHDGFLPSMTGRSMVSPYRGPRRGPAGGYGPMFPQGYGNHHAPPSRGPENSIDINGIQAGTDVRTTVMLRNIPNRVDCHELKAMIDETSFGCYDFIYLRIDFANRCNVGYAFINFATPEDIIPFALARQGRRWGMFNSSKHAQISYATIQGRENLIQKFRNSSVMFEHKDFVPKLYTPGTGLEERFPDPDNLWKMRRSMENADSIGLFVRGYSRRRGGYGYLPPANTRDIYPEPQHYSNARYRRRAAYRSAPPVAPRHSSSGYGTQHSGTSPQYMGSLSTRGGEFGPIGSRRGSSQNSYSTDTWDSFSPRPKPRYARRD